MKKCFICIMVVLLLVSALSGCSQKNESQDLSNSGVDSSNEKISCQFTEMPEKSTEFAEVFISNNVAIFTFVVAGLDTASTELVTYDILADKLLGSLNLGEDDVSVLPTENGMFAVFSRSKNCFSVYNSSCETVSSHTLEGIKEEIGFVGYNGGHLLLSFLSSGKVALYDLSSHKVADINLPAESYQFIGTNDSLFLIESYEKGIISITNAAQTNEIFKGSSAQVVGNSYAAGVKGDYVTIFPLSGGDPVMAPKKGNGEVFCSAEGIALLSHSQSVDMKDELYFYTTDTMTVAQNDMDGQVVDAAIYGKGAVAITRDTFGGVLKYNYVDFSNSDFVSVNSHTYDNSALNGVQSLPEPQGTAETVALIQRINEEYGVRIVYEEGVFNLDNLGFTVTLTSESEAVNKILILEELLAFLPEGLLKEMNETRPTVIYLCEELMPSAGGINTVLDGYNVSFLSVTGNNDYFLSVAAHEMAHAIEQGIDRLSLSGWCELMPKEAQKAYNNLSLTVEFTPDDNGKTPVWFIEAYGRSSEMEDRAVIFAAMFDAYRSGDYTLFDYDGIRKKADYWCEMLEESYLSCINIESFWKNKPLS